MAERTRWGRAEFGAIAGIGGALFVWIALPSLLPRVPRDANAELHSIFAVLALVVAFAAAVVIWHLFDGFWLRRVEDRPTSRVRSLAAGDVELAGSAGEASLRSPLSDRACVYWDYSIWRIRSEDELESVCFRSSSDWPILLRDATGSIWVDTRESEVVPSRSEESMTTRKRRPNPRIARFLELHGVTPGTVEIQERWIESGDPLFLHGACRPPSETSAAGERVERIFEASRRMVEREKAGPAIVAETALACASSSERRRALEHELETRLAKRSGVTNALDDHALTALRHDAQQASERPLIEKYRRFARWYLAASERTQPPADLAVAAHVETALVTPDQALVVGPDPEAGIPLGLTCLSEREIVQRHRRFRTQMMTAGSIIAGTGFVIGVLAARDPFIRFSFAMLCFAVPFSIGLGCVIRSQWARGIIRRQLPTAKVRFPS